MTAPSHHRTQPASRRSRRRALLALAAPLALASCAVGPTPAASVDGHELSNSDFNALLGDLVELQEFSRFALGDTAVDGDLARDLLTQWISAQVLGDEIARRGGQIGQADLDETDRRLSEGAGGLWQEATDRVRDFFRTTLTAQEVFPRVASPSDADLESLYLQGPEASGATCTRHILLETEEDAQAVLDELRAGADFATMAAERSLDTVTGSNGGIVEPAAGTDCFTTTEFTFGIIPEFVEGTFAAQIGVPTEPVQSQFGYHIILVRPFEEVADSVRNVIGGAASTVLQEELLTSTDARVNSRYGVWVPSVGAVLPVGGQPAVPAATP